MPRKSAVIDSNEPSESESEASQEISPQSIDSSPPKNIPEISISPEIIPKPSLHLHKIILENFKSFKGKYEVGLFQDLSTVLGPNGSGKSNIIDALSFTLGLQSNALRSKSVKDLIYKPSNSSNAKNEKPADSCSVEVIFRRDKEEDEKEEINTSTNNKKKGNKSAKKNSEKQSETSTFEEISFKREATEKGNAYYYYNNKRIGLDKYSDLLATFNISSQSLFFILGQGGVDVLLSSKKNRIQQIIETLSGSIKYKEQYDTLVKELKEEEEKLNSLSTKVNNIKADKSKITIQIENKEQYDELYEKINKLMTKIYLYEFAEKDAIKKCCEENLEKNIEEVEKIKKEKSTLLTDIKKHERENNKIKKDFEQAQSDCKEQKLKLDLITEKINAKRQEKNTIEGVCMNNNSILNQLREDEKKAKEKKKKLQSQITLFQKEMEVIEKKLNMEDQSAKLGITPEQVKEYKTLSLLFETNVESNRRTIIENNVHVQDKNGKKQLLEKNLSNAEKEVEIIENDINKIDKVIRKLEMEYSQNTVNLEEMRKNLLKFNEEKEKLQKEYNDMYAELQEKISEISNLQIDTFETNKRKKISEFMHRNTNVKGFLFELVSPLQKKFEIPVKVSLLRVLGHLIVTNSETSHMLSDFLLQNEINCDVIVQENLPKESFTITQDMRKKLGYNGSFMSDLISCKSEDIAKIVRYFVKDLVLVHDVNNIKILRQLGFSKMITIDGTMFKNNVLSGGTYKGLDRYSFAYSDLENKEDQSGALKAKIDSLTAKIKENLSKQDKLEKELEVSKEITDLEKSNSARKNEISDKQKRKEEYEKNKKEKEIIINNCKEGITNLENEVSAYKKVINDNLEMISSAKERFFRDFRSRHQINDIKVFETYTLEEMNEMSDDLVKIKGKIYEIEKRIKDLEKIDAQIKDAESKYLSSKNEKKILENESAKLSSEKLTIQKDFDRSQSNLKKTEESLNEIKAKIAKANEDLNNSETRLKCLVKGEVEIKHKIQVAQNDKKQLFIDLSTDPNKILRETGDEKAAVLITDKFDINKYVIQKGNDSKDKSVSSIDKSVLISDSNKEIDYSLIEEKSSVSLLSIEEIAEIIANKKEKLFKLLIEIQKYVNYIPSNEDEEEKLKEKDTELNQEKKEVKKKIEKIIAEIDAKKKELSEIKEKRKGLFTNFFLKLQEILKKTYKEMTEKDNIPGGNAFLHLTNTEEPFNGEVIYLPTPPGKRAVYDIEQLSGGEKTIAIVSLLSSLQKITGTPMLVFDEVDSYLDRSHEDILKRFFSEEKNKVQIVIVSHKLKIYKDSSSLVGVYFSQQFDSSVPVYLDLSVINN